MSLYEERSEVTASVIMGLGLVVGLAAGGWFIGQGMARFKSDTRTVTVKGLVEREVKSDQAVWTLGLRRASDALPDAHQRITADRDTVLAFLKKQGFADAEVERQPTRTVDKLARDYAGQQNERFRYVVTASVVVKSAPGHTPGHQVLFVRLAKRGPVLLAGDLYHYPEERSTGRTPAFETDRAQTLVTRARIEAFLKQTGATLWIEHDLATHATLPFAPAFID